MESPQQASPREPGTEKPGEEDTTSNDVPLAGGSVSASTMAWNRYSRYTKLNERRPLNAWRSVKASARKPQPLETMPDKSKFGDEVVSKIILLTRWKTRARQQADGRAFTMTTRRPWLSHFRENTERTGCVLAAGMEHDGMTPHVDMVLKVSHAEMDQKIEDAAEQHLQDFTPMNVIKERVKKAMREVRMFTTDERFAAMVISDEGAGPVEAAGPGPSAPQPAEPSQPSADEADAIWPEDSLEQCSVGPEVCEDEEEDDGGVYSPECSCLRSRSESGSGSTERCPCPECGKPEEEPEGACEPAAAAAAADEPAAAAPVYKFVRAREEAPAEDSAPVASPCRDSGGGAVSPVEPARCTDEVVEVAACKAASSSPRVAPEPAAAEGPAELPISVPSHPSPKPRRPDPGVCEEAPAPKAPSPPRPAPKANDRRVNRPSPPSATMTGPTLSEPQAWRAVMAPPRRGPASAVAVPPRAPQPVPEPVEEPVECPCAAPEAHPVPEPAAFVPEQAGPPLAQPKPDPRRPKAHGAPAHRGPVPPPPVAKIPAQETTWQSFTSTLHDVVPNLGAPEACYVGAQLPLGPSPPPPTAPGGRRGAAAASIIVMKRAVRGKRTRPAAQPAPPAASEPSVSITARAPPQLQQPPGAQERTAAAGAIKHSLTSPTPFDRRAGSMSQQQQQQQQQLRRSGVSLGGHNAAALDRTDPGEDMAAGPSPTLATVDLSSMWNLGPGGGGAPQNGYRYGGPGTMPNYGSTGGGAVGPATWRHHGGGGAAAVGDHHRRHGFTSGGGAGPTTSSLLEYRSAPPPPLPFGSDPVGPLSPIERSGSTEIDSSVHGRYGSGLPGGRTVAKTARRTAPAVQLDHGSLAAESRPLVRDGSMSCGGELPSPSTAPPLPADDAPSPATLAQGGPASAGPRRDPQTNLFRRGISSETLLCSPSSPRGQADVNLPGSHFLPHLETSPLSKAQVGAEPALSQQPSVPHRLVPLSPPRQQYNAVSVAGGGGPGVASPMGQLQGAGPSAAIPQGRPSPGLASPIRFGRSVGTALDSLLAQSLESPSSWQQMAVSVHEAVGSAAGGGGGQQHHQQQLWQVQTGAGAAQGQLGTLSAAVPVSRAARQQPEDGPLSGPTSGSRSRGLSSNPRAAASAVCLSAAATSPVQQQQQTSLPPQSPQLRPSPTAVRAYTLASISAASASAFLSSAAIAVAQDESLGGNGNGGGRLLAGGDPSSAAVAVAGAQPSPAASTSQRNIPRLANDSIALLHPDPGSPLRTSAAVQHQRSVVPQRAFLPELKPSVAVRGHFHSESSPPPIYQVPRAPGVARLGLEGAEAGPSLNAGPAAQRGGISRINNLLGLSLVEEDEPGRLLGGSVAVGQYKPLPRVT